MVRDIILRMLGGGIHIRMTSQEVTSHVLVVVMVALAVVGGGLQERQLFSTRLEPENPGAQVHTAL